jgi:hypothetical protein
MKRSIAVALTFVAISIVYTWPLAREGRTRIPGDAGDPSLNASILWWNATQMPFSSEWWNARQYYPAEGAAAFTESLAGISPIATPVYAATHSAVLAYNVAYFLSWPLLAFATYLLILKLTGRWEIALVGGAAAGFSPYRLSEIGHLQMLASYWMPLCLLGLHGYFADRRIRWLVLFGAGWVLLSLANGHFMLFGAVLIALWLLYFGSRGDTWRLGLRAAIAWALASVPLLPVMLKFKAIHDANGLHRSIYEALVYSARPHAFVETTALAWRWLLPSGRDNMFPGLVAVALVGFALVSFLSRSREPAHGNPRRRWLLVVVAMAAIVNIAGVLLMLTVGPYRGTVLGIPLRVTGFDRASSLAAICGVAWIFLFTPTREVLKRRSALVFYASAALAFAVFACGPQLRLESDVGVRVLLEPAPYAWLLKLPGFNELRVTLRIWMIGVVVLTTAGALGLDYVLPRNAKRRWVAVVIAGIAVFDGWPDRLPMADLPERWTAEMPSRSVPLVELPIGLGFDYPATFRQVYHGRRLVNGVSGYDAPGYVALVEGLQNRDSRTLEALASFGPLDAIVSRQADPGHQIQAFVAGYPGAVNDGAWDGHVVFRVPASSFAEPPLGPPLPIARITASGNDDNAELAHDGTLTRAWGEGPQHPGQWLLVDLGEVRQVGGVTHYLGLDELGFPRGLDIETSIDAATWEAGRSGPVFAEMFLASRRAPLARDMRFALAPRMARFVRLRQTATSRFQWYVPELTVHAPRSPSR